MSDMCLNLSLYLVQDSSLEVGLRDKCLGLNPGSIATSYVTMDTFSLRLNVII